MCRRRQATYLCTATITALRLLRLDETVLLSRLVSSRTHYYSILLFHTHASDITFHHLLGGLVMVNTQ